MTEMAGPEHAPRTELDGVPEGEQISEADAVERADAEPDEQENQKDPVWDEDDKGE